MKHRVFACENWLVAFSYAVANLRKMIGQVISYDDMLIKEIKHMSEGDR